MSQRILVTGGAGFVGSTLVRAWLDRGATVDCWDDLSRIGSTERLAALKSREDAERLHFVKLDVANRAAVDAAATEGPWDVVYHLAAQVAVTWSLQDPVRDFATNALGAFNVIEAIRRESPQARCVHISSNKVFGELEDLSVEADGPRLRFASLPEGVDHRRALDPATPYGVSKAAGECAFRDAARTWGMDTVVLRCSCIYGPRQSQQEDQGWVSWFAHAVDRGLPIRIFGDGRTTRDMLFVDDLVDLLRRIADGPSPPRGLTLPIGGGRSNARSLLEVVRIAEQHTGRRADLSFHAERPSDQKVFVTDIREATRLYGWAPTVGPEDGIATLLGQSS